MHMLKTTPARVILRGSMVAALASLLAVPAYAVNIPEGGAVTPDSTYIIHFHVREVCDGAPMDTLEVTIPASVQNPTPEAIEGWDVEVETPSMDSGEASGDAPTIVRWTGGPLEAGSFMEFGLWARFPDEPNATLEFPVVQRCGTVERTWSGSDGETAAPTVKLTERVLQRDLEELTASLDEVVGQVDELGSQLGDVDVANLRSRVSDAEDSQAEMSGQLDEILQRLEALEQAMQE
jgi:uncharacterized protein YcnI